MRNRNKLAGVLALLLCANAALISCSGGNGGSSSAAGESLPGGEKESVSQTGSVSGSGSEEELPENEVRGYTLFAYREGTTRFEAENVDVTRYKKSGDNDTVVVSRADASGGKFLAAATGAISDDQYFEFSLSLSFSAQVSMTAAYAQTNKWKGYDEDMKKSYTYIIDGNRNMMISSAKTVLAAREDITVWETFAYTSVTLPAGEHTFRVKVAENTGKGNPNIDYFDFTFEKTGAISPDEEDGVPVNDFHSGAQYAYLNDPDYENVAAYASGVTELSRPRGNLLDFSEDVADAASYVLQYSSNSDFSDATTVEGLKQKQYRLYNLKLGETVYYRAATDKNSLSAGRVHSLAVAEKGVRNLYIDGVTNVRDIGGYDSSLVKNGKIRQGLYFRGANLNNITEEGKRQLLSLGIKTEIDLRDAYQCAGPYVDGVGYNAVPIPSGTEGTRFEAFEDEYKRIFALIADADRSPVYLHCTAGADRTGICTFMLLAVCGASYEDMARDYLFTNFSTHGSRVANYNSEFKQWWAKLDRYEGATKADKAKSWLVSKGVTEEQVEKIRKIFVENY